MDAGTLPALPPSVDLESKCILKRVSDANRELARLKDFSRTIPNQYVLLRALSLQAAKDSSEIENIITTNDELYQLEVFPHAQFSAQAKEVCNYAEALSAGFDLI